MLRKVVKHADFVEVSVEDADTKKIYITIFRSTIYRIVQISLHDWHLVSICNSHNFSSENPHFSSLKSAIYHLFNNNRTVIQCCDEYDVKRFISMKDKY